jgi:CcmD family protein
VIPRNHISLALVLALIAVLALPGLALASTHAQEIPGESNLGFLMAGLIIIWAGFFAYVFYISRKTNELRREIDDLRDQLASKDPE